MEFLHPVSPQTIKVAVFDFDGTLSLLRTGWQEIMVHLMSQVLSTGSSSRADVALPAVKSPGMPQGIQRDSPELQVYLRDVVDNSTGRQTIDQMQLLAQFEQGLDPDTLASGDGRLLERALELKAIYLGRLKNQMGSRLQSLRLGTLPASDFLVCGAADFLGWLASKGVKLCLISGTDQECVVTEAELLGIRRFFGDMIFGGLDVAGAFTKYQAMQQVIVSCAADKSQVLTFGDGIMDIRSARDAGVFAVGVASDEIKRAGVNPVKRKQLIDAGAEAIIGDYDNFEDWIGKIML
jgi:phosphoglycolate phosphatase-like HAD superfamily hydrolase